jgi:CRP-like cAMP-binding protein
MSSDIDTLSALYLFQAVPRPSLQALLQVAPAVSFSIAQPVFRQGDAAESALLLLSGRFTVEVQEGGATRTIGEVHPGEVVGETALFLPGARRTATVRAREPSRALVLRPEVMDLAGQNPAVVLLEQHLLGTLSRRIRSTNLAIQGVWKAEAPAPAPPGPAAAAPPPPPPTLRGRLASLFGAR